MKNNFVQIAQQKVLAMLVLREEKNKDHVMTRNELKNPGLKWTPGIKIDTNRKN